MGLDCGGVGLLREHPALRRIHIRGSQSGQKGPIIKTIMMPIHVRLSDA